MLRDICLLLIATAVIVGLRLAAHSSEHMTSELYMWPTLMKAKIHTDYVHQVYTADIPKDVKAMSGKPMTLGGFMVPIETGMKASHFLLSRRASSCPFCSAGEPNELVEVDMAQPMDWTDERVVLTGMFSVIDDRRNGLFYKMTGAKAP